MLQVVTCSHYTYNVIITILEGQTNKNSVKANTSGSNDNK